MTFIRNVTDIDDKILHKAVHEEMPWWAVAMKYERAFADAYAALNVMPPTYEPRATGHVTQMIELMQKLIERGAAYAPGNGDVSNKCHVVATLCQPAAQNIKVDSASDVTNVWWCLHCCAAEINRCFAIFN